MEVLLECKVSSGTSLGTFLLYNPAPVFDGRKAFIPKIALVTIWNKIDPDIFLKGMAVWADLTRSLTEYLNCSISGTCYLLNEQFRNMTRSSILSCRVSNLLSVCIHVVLRPRCRYVLRTYSNLSIRLFNLRFVIILTVANIICCDMVLINLIPLM